MFTRDRFQLLLQFFHVVDNSSIPPRDSPNYDPAAKFMPVFNHVNKVFKAHYLPGQFLSVDESLVGTRGRSKIIQFMPNKRHSRFGVKLWMLIESATKFCYQLFVYRGSKYDKVPEKGLGYDIVIRLLRVSNLLNRAYHVVVDNFFTGIQLARDLLSVGTFLTGTIRYNRLPRKIQKANVAVGQTKYWRDNELLLSSFHPQKTKRHPVAVMSTNGEAKNVVAKQKIKPSVITEIYNKYMGGVDCHDQMLYAYHDERKTVKVWKKVVFNLISQMLLNAYAIYIQNTSDTKKLIRKHFNLSVIQSLAQDHLRGVAVVKSKKTKIEAGVRKLPGSKEKDCCICSDRKNNIRRRSKTVCVVCHLGLHLSCQPQHKHCVADE